MMNINNFLLKLYWIQYFTTIGLFSVGVFMYGFFPIKSSSNMFSSKGDIPIKLFNTKFHKEMLYSKSVGKTTLMIIDGIRVDFITKENMPYTFATLEKKEVNSCQLTARVSAPTVTLPRIKAIVTGTVPSFIDVVLNFGTKQLTIDNMIHQVTENNKKVVFYGDDTWIKLFPQQFVRKDGTSSFFVNDYSEVDDNVTRHLTSELGREDWDVMILHYLGLDHIGHIEGPKSSLIQPKLREMDEIIAKLFSVLAKQGDGLLVICGDHGMKDSGSHGGVSLPEVLVPVVALGLDCSGHDKREILQVDLAATLSVLWGTPIPADSIGVIVPTLLSHLSPAQRLFAHLYNAQQLANNFLRNGGSISHESYKLYEEANQAYHSWLTNSSTLSAHEVETLYQSSLLGMSRHLSTVMANYDKVALLSAIVIVLQVVISLAMRLEDIEKITLPAKLVPTIAISSVFAGIVSKLVISRDLTTLPTPIVFSVTLILLLHTVYLYHQVKSVKMLLANWSWLHSLILVGTVLFLCSLFSSSFVEEEHQLWYFLIATLGGLSIYKLRCVRGSLMWFGVLVTHRVLRTLNQTGDQWAHLPDLSDWLIRDDNKLVLTIIYLISITLVLWCCFKLSSSPSIRFLCTCSVVCNYLHKAALQQVIGLVPSLSTSGVLEARLCFLLILLQLVITRSMKGLVISWMLFISLLLRSYNVPLVPALFFFSQTLCSLSPPVYVTSALHHWLGAAFFFYQGNSNSLASVDVATGYVGLEEYNVAVVGALLLSHTYAMPVLAFLLNLLANSNFTRNMAKSCQTVALLQLLHVLMTFVSVTIHRYHLFVWTVFSPKLLYIAAQTFVYFLLISITTVFLYCFQRIKTVDL